MNRHRKIAVIHAGGTTCMSTNPKTNAIRDQKEEDRFDSIHRFLPEIQKFTSCDFFPLYDEGSSEMNPEKWTQLAAFIHERIHQYEGFVVIHGTNTLAYTASALSFAFQNLSVPIVFTGGNRPINDLSSDARQNIVFACMVASMDIAEVCLVYGKRILRANCAKKISDSYASAFATPFSYGKLGEVHRNISLYDNRVKRRKRALDYQPQFKGNILLLKALPGLDVNLYTPLLEKIDGLLVEGYGPGHLPESDGHWMALLDTMQRMNKPVVICSQMDKGEVTLDAYDRGKRLLEKGVIPGGEMTVECAYAKLLWCLGQGMSLGKIKRTMAKSLAQEMAEKSQPEEIW